MLYAVRNDKLGCKIVATADDVGPDEFLSERGPELVEASASEIFEAADRAKSELLALATIRIAPLQDAVDLDEATPDDVADLKRWKQYRVAVNRAADQPGYPATVEWPDQPV